MARKRSCCYDNLFRYSKSISGINKERVSLENRCKGLGKEPIKSEILANLRRLWVSILSSFHILNAAENNPCDDKMNLIRFAYRSEIGAEVENAQIEFIAFF